VQTNINSRDAAQTSTATPIVAAGNKQALPDGAQNVASWIAVWRLALTAAAVLAVDPTRLNGVVLRSRAGPVRDTWLREFLAMLPPGAAVKRVPSNIADGRLLGGLDLASTLATGRPVAERGVLADCDGGVAIFPMAERMSSYTAAKLACVIDSGVVIVERDGRREQGSSGGGGRVGYGWFLDEDRALGYAREAVRLALDKRRGHSLAKMGAARRAVTA
jgi:magnesium chelatase subunit D